MNCHSLLFTLSSVLLAPAAFSATILDDIYGVGAGSFEIPDPNNLVIPTYVTYQSGSTAMPGWTVGSGSVDRVKNSVWSASQGIYSIDMNGTVASGPPSVGSINTIFATTAGTTYTITFDVSGYLGFSNPANPKQMEVSVEAVNLANVSSLISSTQVQFVATNNSTSSPLTLNWETRTIQFTASEAQTRITFTSQTTTNHSGILLDNVAVQPIPEPTSVLLLGSGALLFSMRRRRA